MKGLLFAVLLQFTWSFGSPQLNNGAGSFAYADSSGRRNSGTYNLQNGRVVQTSGDIPVPFSETAFPGYGYGFDYGLQAANFYPTYFLNLENLLQEAFQSNVENQNIAYNAAKKAFDLTSNQAGYYQNFATRLPQPPFNRFAGPVGGFPVFPEIPRFNMQNFQNSAFASAAVGPGFRSQVAQISPENPNNPNVRISGPTPYSNDPNRHYYSVSSNSYSTSTNVNGKQKSTRGSTTVIDDNGKVTKYSVHN